MAVITISRQFGAGGVRVADRLAEALGWQRVDREILDEAAQRLGLDAEAAEPLDERAPGLIEDAALALAAAGPAYGVAAQAIVDDQALAGSMSRVIRSLAARGGYVIVGRGGQAVLAERDDTCHLQLVAELEDRARRIAEWHGMSLDEARDRCRRMDADRAAYVHRFHDVDIADPLRYDAVLNTSRLSLDAAGDAAVDVARRRLGL